MGSVGVHTSNSLSLFKKTLLFWKVTGGKSIFCLCWIQIHRAITSALPPSCDDSHHKPWRNMLWRPSANADTLSRWTPIPWWKKTDPEVLCKTRVTAHLFVYAMHCWFCRRCKKYLNALLPTNKIRNQFCEVWIFWITILFLGTAYHSTNDYLSFLHGFLIQDHKLALVDKLLLIFSTRW